MKIFAFLATLALVSLVVLFYNLTPKTNANWVDYLVYQPETNHDIESNTLTIKPLRDWQYGVNDTIVSKDWRDTQEMNINELESVWFVLEAFGKIPAVGHTFLTFEFKNGESYSFSIEARREVGEPYSTVKGMFNTYEVAYTWSTERDAISRRVVKDGHRVKMYKLNITDQEEKALLLAAANATNQVAAVPMFYNTLTSNCTNLLAKLVNDLKPETLPYHLAWNLPGLSDKYLMNQNFITIDGNIDRTMESASLIGMRDELASVATGTSAEFSLKLRELLSNKQTSL